MPCFLALLSMISAAEQGASEKTVHYQTDPTASGRLQRGATQLQVLRE